MTATKNMKKILAVCLVVLLVSPIAVSAATTPFSSCRSDSSASAPPPELGQCVSQVYLWALGAAGILALIMMLIGGYYVITASGNAANASKGKSYLMSSLIGLLILLGAFLLLNTINPDLVCLKVDVSAINPNTGSGASACGE